MAQDPRALLAKADSLASSAKGGFSFFGGRETKFMDAADLYIQAANAFKMQGGLLEAGQTFEKAAYIQKNNLKEPDDEANTLIDASKSYRKVSPEDSARCLNQAINHYCSRGNFRRAASHKESLGEMFEMELGDQARALECYEAAAEWYSGDGATALANKLLIKVADLAALHGDFYKAIEKYESVAQSSITSNLMKYSVKEYFLKAGICHLATGDVIGTRRALEKYRDLDPTFPSQREHQLLVDICDAVEAGDQERFADKLYAYDQMSKLDKWKTQILLKIKNQIEEADNEFS